MEKPEGPGPRRWTRPGLLLAALIVLLPCPALAADDDRIRPYLGFRLGVGTLLDGDIAPGIDATPTQQLTGFSLGLNLGRHLGIELAGDAFETNLKLPGAGTIGEYGVFALVPQLRLRYPLLDGRLTPYVLGGVGVGFAEFNDRKSPAFGRSVEAGDVGLVATVGGGVEYFVADNIALGFEARYLRSRDHEIEIDGRSSRANLDALLTAVNLRVFLSGGPPVAAAAPARRGDRGLRGYLGFRVGGGALVTEDIASGLRGHAENSALAETMNLLFGVVLGVEVTRHLGVELAADGFEINLRRPGLGTVGEYAMYGLVPQVRVRYPVLDNRLVPYLVAGVGAGYAETNDIKASAGNVEVQGKGVALIATAGGGVDYFLANNLSVGIEVKYRFARDHEVQIGGRNRTLDLDAVLTTVGFTIFFP